MTRPTRLVALAMAATALVASALAEAAQPLADNPVTLRVNVFRSATNIPIYMAEEKGAFSRRNVRVELQFTPSSSEQRVGLAAGRSDIAHTAVDNAVAMVEVAKVDAPAELARLGLNDHLSAQRSNGLRAMVERIRDVASRA